MNAPEETVSEQNNGNPDEERKKPVNRLFRGLMSAAVIAAASVFIYLLIYFAENTGV